MYIGVDIGKNGGIASLDKHDILCCNPMPTLGKKHRELSFKEIFALLKHIKDCANSKKEQTFLVIEDATASPIWSKQVTGELYGCRMAFEAFAVALDIPYELKKASVWQKEIFAGMKKTDTKSMALMYTTRRFPGTDWTPTEKSNKPHDGMIDAACIAEYCRRIFT